jgi:hypothetical protein
MKDNIKMYFKGVDRLSVKWTKLAKGSPVAAFYEASYSTKAENFLPS